MRRIIEIVTIVAIAVAIITLTGCSRGPDTEDLVNELTRRAATTTTTYEEPEYDGDSDVERLTYLVPEFEDVPISELREFLGLVCDAIDESDGDFFSVGETVIEAADGYFDLDFSDAGSIVAVAVKTECPEWTDAALEFANS